MGDHAKDWKNPVLASVVICPEESDFKSHHILPPGGSDGKDAVSGDWGLIPGSGRSPGKKNSYPLQYSHLENPMDRGAWWATVYEAAKSRTQLSNEAHMSG